MGSADKNGGSEITQSTKKYRLYCVRMVNLKKVQVQRVQLKKYSWEYNEWNYVRVWENITV
jgi:hypothetical protein